jgi:hypothetical protein
VTEPTDYAHATLEDGSHSMTTLRRIHTYRQNSPGAYHSGDRF